MANYFYKPVHWRMRAEMTRTIADGMNLDEFKSSLMHIADEYDRMANRLEKDMAKQVREARQSREAARTPPADDMSARLVALQQKFQRVGK